MRWLLLLGILLFTAPCQAEYKEIGFAKYPPGSLRIRYGGPYKTVVEYTRSYLRDVWGDFFYQRWNYGLIDYDEYQDSVTRIDNEMTDMDNGGRWWERRWYESFEEKNGGAPTPTYHYIGTTILLADLCIFTLSNDLSFKIKKIERTIDTQNTCNGYFSGEGFKFVIAPDISFGIPLHFDSISEFIRSVSINLIIREISNFITRVDLKFSIRYRLEYDDTLFMLGIKLPMWS